MSLPQFSPRLTRAVAAEQGRLARERERIERAQAGVRAQLEQLEHELAQLDERLDLLLRVAPSAVDTPPSPEPADTREGPDSLDVTRLHGAAIREAAVRLLVGQRPRQAVHYRDWYGLMQARGFEVGGTTPLAVFLTQITRSPIVRQTGPPGVYEIDDGAPQRLRDSLAALQAELRGLTEAPNDREEAGALRRRRHELVRTIARHERGLEEATRGLAVPLTHDLDSRR